MAGCESESRGGFGIKSELNFDCWAHGTLENGFFDAGDGGEDGGDIGGKVGIGIR